MSRCGADPAALDDLAERLRSGADRLSRSGDGVGSLLGAIDWVGRDRLAFDRRMGPLQQDLRRAAVDLARFADELARQADEQRTASSVDGSGRAGTVTTPDGGRPGDGAVAGGTGETRAPGAAVPTTGAGALRWLDDAGSPAEVRRRWSALGTGLQGLVLARDPARLGNRDGIPPEVRMTANRRRIAEDLDRATGPRRSLLAGWLTPTRDPVTGEVAQPQVLLYDPGRERIAVVHGDLHGSDHVVLAVPGTGTALGAYRTGTHPGQEEARAEALYTATNRRAEGGVAVVSWLGYDSPTWTADDGPELGGAAEHGGRDLRTLVDGLGLSDEQRLALVGHSYGAVVVGEGVLHGARPDNVVFLGAPGTGVDEAGDLGLDEGADVFAMRAPLDPVGGLERFGTSPTDPSYGAIRLPASAEGMFNHGSYWSGDNLDQLAAALTDGPTGAGGPTAGEVAADLLTRSVRTPDEAVDALQEVVPFPEPLDHVVDALQRPTKTVTSTAEVLLTETVDGVGVLADRGRDAVTDALSDLGGWFVD